MRTRVVLVAALIVAASLASCTDDWRTEPVGPAVPALPSSTGPAPGTLPLGKSDFRLEQGVQYTSPEGFVPTVQFEIFTDGWRSTHRSPDAFDVSIPAPKVDAPLVVRAFLVPPEPTVKEALAAITQRAAQAGATIERNGDFVVHGGDGPLIESRDGGVALDAAPDGYVRVATQDTKSGPLLYVWWVPDGANAQLVDDPDHSVASTVQVN
jgi:hypothetical protein